MYCKESEEIKCEKAVDLYTCIEMLCKKKIRMRIKHETNIC